MYIILKEVFFSVNMTDVAQTEFRPGLATKSNDRILQFLVLGLSVNTNQNPNFARAEGTMKSLPISYRATSCGVLDAMNELLNVCRLVPQMFPMCAPI